ncbi:MAG: gliding motility-associated C-terminal domain-containing protein [Crocinitomicaceae bacterium]|nr:gliding motility-associated C-terminal domain-containing protein [Crocinitomicaceae bacterium]
MKLNDLLCGCVLMSSAAFAQPSNDNCINAEQLCPNVTLNGTTTGATSAGATDYNFCSVSAASVWYKFTTDSDGGSVTINVSNLSFNADITMGQQITAQILDAPTPCSNLTYVIASACAGGSTDFSVTSAALLLPNKTYYFLINGIATGAGVTQAAQCDFDISISGDGVEQTTPTASIAAANTVLCEGESEIVSSTITNASDTVNFNWYFNNALISSSPTQATFDAINLSGTGYLKLIFESDLICTVSDTTDSIYFEITPISANAGPDKFIAEGDQVMLDGSGTGLASWTPASSLTSSTSLTPIASPAATTTYFLTVTNGACTATDSVNVFVGEIITIYSSFTPNGDDINDTWVIRNSSQFENMKVTIYDRSGQIVYETVSYSAPDKWWDGTLHNKGEKPLPASTYFYVIDLIEGDDPIYKGSVTIIR